MPDVISSGKKKKYVIEQLKKEFIERGASFHGYKPETTTQDKKCGKVTMV